MFFIWISYKNWACYNTKITIYYPCLENIRVTHINSSAPSDTIWWHKTWSTLVQVMVCSLTTPSHYWNQCWLITSEVLWSISLEMFKISTIRICWKNCTFKITAIFLSGQWVEIRSLDTVLQHLLVIEHYVQWSYFDKSKIILSIFPSCNVDQICYLIDRSHIYIDYHHEGLPSTVWLTLWHSNDDTPLSSYKLFILIIIMQCRL